MAILTTNWQLLGQSYLGTSGGNLYVRLYAKYSEQSIENNKSLVQYQSRAYYENSTYIYDAQGNGGISGTGASPVSGSCTRPTTGETIIATTEGWVGHNDNGSQSISASAYLNFPNWGWSATTNGSADLPTIPRASSIAVGHYNLGQNISIVIGKKDNSFTSTLTYKIGSRTGTIATKISNSTFVWEMSSELIEQIKQDNPSNKNVNAIIYCDTYSGDTKIGDTQPANFTLVITDRPTIDNVLMNETIELISQYTTSIIKYLSAPKFTITATPSVGTNISKYVVKVGDRESTGTSNEITVNNVNDITDSTHPNGKSYIFYKSKGACEKNDVNKVKQVCTQQITGSLNYHGVKWNQGKSNHFKGQGWYFNSYIEKETLKTITSNEQACKIACESKIKKKK